MKCAPRKENRLGLQKTTKKPRARTFPREKELEEHFKEQSRVAFLRQHVRNRSNKLSVMYDPVSMRVNDTRILEQEDKDREKLRTKRILAERRDHSEAFDIVTHLERKV